MIAGTAFGTYHAVRSKVHRNRLPGAFALVFAALALLTTLLAPLTSPAAAEWSAPRTVYIDQTGQSLDQVFLDVWREGGGANSYGYPITPEITLDNGHVVQYFGYARFEYWPEGDAEGKHFHFGNIGEELRPTTVQRSIATWNSTTAASSERSEESFLVSRAWLPVTEKNLAADARFIEATSHTVSGEFRQFWENTGEEWYLGNPLTEEYTTGDTTYQVFERGQLAYNATDGTTLVPVGQLLADRYNLDQAPVAQGDLPSYSEDLFIPPPEPEPAGVGGTGYVPGGGEVWVDINLSSQYMLIYQGDAVIGETYISSGRAGFETPTGTFHVNSKYVSDDMEGVLGGEYYNVPEVPDVMYFTDVGHAIHGAYWHNNFGTPMSHGCINMPLGMAEWLYSIAPIGMTVVIHY